MAKKSDRGFVVRSTKTGQFITVSEAKASPKTAVFEEQKNGNGKPKKFRPVAADTGEFVIGRYMLLEPVKAVTKG